MKNQHQFSASVNQLALVTFDQYQHGARVFSLVPDMLGRLQCINPDCKCCESGGKVWPSSQHGAARVTRAGSQHSLSR